MKFLKPIFIFFIFLASFIFIVGVLIYKPQNQDNKFLASVSRFVPYPAAMVNGEIITVVEFQKNLKTAKYYYNATKGVDLNVKDFSENETKRLILSHLIEDKIISQQLKEYNLKISKEDIDEKLREIINSTGSKENVLYEIKELYNWTISDFENNSLGPSLKYEKLKRAYNGGVISKENTGNFNQWLELCKKKAKIKIFVSQME